jgi:flagellar basal-body rod protein FlgB
VKLFDRTIGSLESALDARLVRQNVLAGNVANVDTPDYRPQEVSFAQAFSEAQQSRQNADTRGPELTTRPGDLPLGMPALPLAGKAAPATETGAAGVDGNRVDLDRTMAAMAENALQYGASARSVAKKLSMLRFVASDGNG